MWMIGSLFLLLTCWITFCTLDRENPLRSISGFIALIFLILFVYSTTAEYQSEVYATNAAYQKRVDLCKSLGGDSMVSVYRDQDQCWNVAKNQRIILPDEIVKKIQ